MLKSDRVINFKLMKNHKKKHCVTFKNYCLQWTNQTAVEEGDNIFNCVGPPLDEITDKLLFTLNFCPKKHGNQYIVKHSAVAFTIDSN